MNASRHRGSAAPIAPPGAASGHWRAAAVVSVVAAAYTLLFVRHGWIPDDEGHLGHAAERVLGGELPHRDFIDLYTGGLDFWHALAFAIGGVRILSLRWALYLATLVFVPILYWLFARFARPREAAVLTLTAFVWSVPNYFASMPSWYNLFWAAAALLAFFRHLETERRRWLLVAGLATGCSILCKSVGLLLFAAGLLFLVYRESELESSASSGDESEVRGRLASWIVAGGLLALVASLALLVSGRPGPMELLHFVLPGAVLAGFLVVREWRRPPGDALRRLRRLFGLGLPFVLGTGIPISLFLLPYLLRGAASEFLRIEVWFPTERLSFGFWSLPVPLTLLCCVPILTLLVAPAFRDSTPTRIRNATGVLIVASLLVLAYGSNSVVYQTVWLGLRPLVPAMAVVAVWVLRRDPSSLERQRSFLVVGVAVLTSVVQFPYSRSIHFLYVAPLVLLGWVALVRRLPGGGRPRHAVLVVFLALFALCWLNPGWVEVMELKFVHFQNDVELGLGRGDGLEVTAEAAWLYRALVAVVQAHAPPGEPIYAGPDSPEVYFLADRPNPTPTILDFLDADFRTPARTTRLLRVLEERRIRVVVLRPERLFSPLDEVFFAEVERRYPVSIELPPYRVHWRDGSPRSGEDG